MAVKAIRMYQSEDGKVHNTIDDALKHNACQKAMSSVKSALHDVGITNGILHMDLVNNVKAAVKLRDALNKTLDYHRRYGKLKK